MLLLTNLNLLAGATLDRPRTIAPVLDRPADPVSAPSAEPSVAGGRWDAALALLGLGGLAAVSLLLHVAIAALIRTLA
jgi:hypothetical protein